MLFGGLDKVDGWIRFLSDSSPPVRAALLRACASFTHSLLLRGARKPRVWAWLELSPIYLVSGEFFGSKCPSLFLMYESNNPPFRGWL